MPLVNLKDAYIDLDLNEPNKTKVYKSGSGVVLDFGGSVKSGRLRLAIDNETFEVLKREINNLRGASCEQ